MFERRSLRRQDTAHGCRDDRAYCLRDIAIDVCLYILNEGFIGIVGKEDLSRALDVNQEYDSRSDEQSRLATEQQQYQADHLRHQVQVCVFRGSTCRSVRRGTSQSSALRSSYMSLAQQRHLRENRVQIVSPERMRANQANCYLFPIVQLRGARGIALVSRSCCFRRRRTRLLLRNNTTGRSLGDCQCRSTHARERGRPTRCRSRTFQVELDRGRGVNAIFKFR